MNGRLDEDPDGVIMNIRRKRLVDVAQERKSIRKLFFPLMCLTSNFH